MNYPKIIVDTNKILAATIKPGRIRTLLYQAPITPTTPTQLLQEVEEHAQEIARKIGISREDFLTLFEKLIEDTTTLATPTQPYIKRAQEIAMGFDLDDWPFIALSLQYNAPIWTNDKPLIKHSLKTRKYKALDTRALEMLIEGVEWKKIEEHLKERYGQDINTQG